MDLFGIDPPRGEPLPWKVAWLFREARILQVAVRLKLFTVLDGQPMSSAELAARLESEPGMTERLLVALAGMELLAHDHGSWRNGVGAALYLVEGKPHYQGEIIEMAARMWDRYHHLERALREGRSRRKGGFSLEESPEQQARYLRALDALALAGRAQRLARLVTPLAGRKRLLDVGGAPGTYCAALCQRFPALKATMLERDAAIEQCRPFLERFEMGERLEIRAGEWQSEPFGKNDFDALLFSHFNPESEPQALHLLMQAYLALRGEGLLILQGHLLDSDLNGARAAALTHLFEHALTLEQIRSLLAEAGFERIQLVFRHAEEPDIVIAFRTAEKAEEPPRELLEYISPEQEMFAMMGLGDEETSLTVQRRAWERLVQTN